MMANRTAISASASIEQEGCGVENAQRGHALLQMPLGKAVLCSHIHHGVRMGYGVCAAILLYAHVCVSQSSTITR